MNIRTNILAIIFCCAAASVTSKALAQQSSINQQLDSIVALLPQLGDSAKIDALATLCNLSHGLPARKGSIIFVSNYYTLAFVCSKTNQWQKMSAYTDSMFVG